MKVFAFHKIIAICRILMSEALYTMDILANRMALLPYQPKCSVFCSLITLKEGCQCTEN